MINVASILSFLATAIVLVHGQTTTCDRSHHCLHGGTCEKGVIANTGETIRVCNCASAIDEFGYKYVGIHCEHQVPRADTAEEARDDPRLCDSNSKFCLHGGQCRNNDDNDPRKCSCTKDYTGQHCEIPKSFDAIKKLSEGSGECSMTCKNGGKCQFGMKDDYKMEGEVSTSVNADSFYQHCECPKGFFGTNCEKRNEICDVTGADVDQEQYCQHGGKCVDTYSVGNSFKEDTHCDCRVGDKLLKDKAYAGRYCEVQSTSICSNGKDNFNGVQFCTNYGTCISDESRRGVYGCSCPEGYTGVHCEYGLGYEPPVAEERKCTRTVCQNGGKCRSGSKDHGLFSEMVKSPELADSLGQLIPKDSNENNEHCVCPEGYAGIHCELEAEICPHGRKICFHGSKCIRDEDEDWGYSCSCNENKSIIYDAADDDGLKGSMFGNYYHGGSDGPIDDDEDRRSLANLAGDHCQYKATSKCSRGHSCFNDGVCYQDGCICHGEFTGPFCEITKKAQTSQNKRSQKRPSLASRHQNTIVLFTFSLAFLGIAFVLLVVAFTRMSGETSKELEGLTARRSSSMISRGHDMGATYLPYPTANAQRNSIDSTDSNSTQSGEGMSPTEEKTVAELI